ncbi:MAG: DUF3307 domain-containing protein [Mediterranea sp.]|jgi:hypothetical protein|nr:DUF3307 domain-containing protein [Mediterranea sp.]
MSLVILLKLLLAHLLADFPLQTDLICEGKHRERPARYLFHVLHALIHAGVSYILVGQWNNWVIPLVLFVTHLTIDIVKLECWKDSITTFIIDQLLHLGVIAGLWFVLFGNAETCRFVAQSLGDYRIWSIIIAYVLLLKPSSLLINMCVRRWTTEIEAKDQSLPNAGQWIGCLERVLILTFILAGYFEGIGFLLAAKSIFRFGELSKAKEIRVTEYVLIGTLLSFTVAILVGMSLIKLLNLIG